MSGAGMSSAEAAPFQVIAILLVIGNQDRGRLVADLIRERVNDDRLDVRMLAQFVCLLVANEHLEKDFAVRLILLDNRVAAPNVFLADDRIRRSGFAYVF